MSPLRPVALLTYLTLVAVVNAHQNLRALPLRSTRNHARDGILGLDLPSISLLPAISFPPLQPSATSTAASASSDSASSASSDSSSSSTSASSSSSSSSSSSESLTTSSSADNGGILSGILSGVNSGLSGVISPVTSVLSSVVAAPTSTSDSASATSDTSDPSPASTSSIAVPTSDSTSPTSSSPPASTTDGGVLSSVIGGVTSDLSSVVGGVTSVVGGVTSDLSSVVSGVTSVVGSVTSDVSSAVSGVTSVLSSVASSVTSSDVSITISPPPSSVTQSASNTGGSVSQTESVSQSVSVSQTESASQTISGSQSDSISQSVSVSQTVSVSNSGSVSITGSVSSSVPVSSSVIVSFPSSAVTDSSSDSVSLTASSTFSLESQFSFLTETTLAVTDITSTTVPSLTNPDQPTTTIANPSSIAVTAIALPTDLPSVIYPASRTINGPADVVDMTAITIMFDSGLNWPFVVNNDISAGQIFAFFPQVVAVALGIDANQVKSWGLKVYIPSTYTSTADAAELATVYIGYIPSQYVNDLAAQIKARSSAFYVGSSGVAGQLAQRVVSSFAINSANPIDSGDASSSLGGSSQSNASASSQNNSRQDAIIGVVTTIGGIALIVLGFLLYRSFQRRRELAHRRMSDPPDNDAGIRPDGREFDQDSVGGSRRRSFYFAEDSLRGFQQQHDDNVMYSSHPAMTQRRPVHNNPISAPILRENTMNW